MRGLTRKFLVKGVSVKPQRSGSLSGDLSVLFWVAFVVLVEFLFSFCCFSLVSNAQKRLTGFAVLKLIFYKAFWRADGERSEPASEASLARQANEASPSVGQVVS